MSFEAQRQAMQQEAGKAATKAVLLVLANHADNYGYCWPGQDLIADTAGMSLRSAQRHLDKLEALGLIMRIRRHKRSGHRSSDGYQFLFFVPPTCQIGSQHDKLAGSQHDKLAGRHYIEEPVSYEPSLSRAETSFEKPFDFDEEAWLEWVDYNLQEFGRVLSPTAQKKQLQTLLAICGETGETQGQVIRRSVESGWKRFHTDRYGSKQRKSSARRGDSSAPASGGNAPVATANRSAAPGNEHVADPERAAAERKNAERKRAAEREQTELLNDLAAAGVDFNQADSHAASLYGALLVGDVARAEQVRVLARRCVLEAQKTALARDGP